VILPSAPALYFGASTLSVIPAGFHQPPPWPPAQGYGANRQMTDSELLMLLKLLQSQPAQGATPPGSGCEKSAYGATGVSGATIEARLSLVESQVKGLQEAVDEHTTRLADVYAKDPELMKKLQVDPGR
jgi:hypothetical protein